MAAIWSIRRLQRPKRITIYVLFIPIEANEMFQEKETARNK